MLSRKKPFNLLLLSPPFFSTNLSLNIVILSSGTIILSFSANALSFNTLLPSTNAQFFDVFACFFETSAYSHSANILFSVIGLFLGIGAPFFDIFLSICILLTVNFLSLLPFFIFFYVLQSIFI